MTAVHRTATVRERNSIRAFRPPAAPRKAAERGQALVEGALALMIFFALLLSVIDCGQMLIAHQSLIERVRSAVRWGVVHPWDGTGDQVANLILYGQAGEPRTATEGYWGLNRANVQVRYRPAAPTRPGDEVLSVAVVNYQYRFLSPWMPQSLIHFRPVMISAPMAYRDAP